MKRRFIILAFSTCLTSALLITACTSAENQGSASQDNSPTSKFAVATPDIPTKVSEDNAEAWIKVVDENPVSSSYLESVASFSYKTAASVLSDKATATPSNDQAANTASQNTPTQGDSASSSTAADSSQAEAAANSQTANSTYSPLSLYYALALATQGAAGQTASDMNDLLATPDGSTVATQSGNFFRTLAADPYSTVALANSIWLSEKDTFKQSFIDVATKQFYATPFSVKFGTPETDAALAAWIKENTQGAIDSEVETSSDQLLSIINTVYFKDSWTNAFKAENTKQDTFHATAGDVTTDFMSQRLDSPLDYTQTSQYTRASLSFAGGATMSFVLPAEGVSAESILADPSLLEEAFTNPATDLAYITYTVPKVSFDTSFDLIPPLQQLGLETPFSDQADFSNLTDTPAYISYIKQESHLAWDENGAEAAAYTNVGISRMAIAPSTNKELDFKLDRPFLFEIKSSHGVPLFIGVCQNPAE